MAKDDFYPQFPDFGEFSLDEQSTPVQADPPEPDFVRAVDLPDYDLDELIRSIVYRDTASGETSPAPEKDEVEPIEPPEPLTEEAPASDEPEEIPGETAEDAWADEPTPRILESRAHAGDEDEELEARFIRRVAARDAGRRRPGRRSPCRPARG